MQFGIYSLLAGVAAIIFQFIIMSFNDGFEITQLCETFAKPSRETIQDAL